MMALIKMLKHQLQPARPQMNRMTMCQLAQNEFEYPIGSIPLSVNLTTLIKHAEKWTFDIQHELDLNGFYNALINQFHPYHIYLRPYNEIQNDEGLQLIDTSTCVNYDMAKTQMSQAILYSFKPIDRPYSKTTQNQ
jgi:hypothetical protein